MTENTKILTYSIISLTDFIQVIAHASGRTVTSLLLQPQLSAWPALSAPASLSAATLPIESCPLLAMRFLPMESPLAPHQASTADVYQFQVPHGRLLPQQHALSTPPSSPAPPLCLPLFGQRQ